MNRLLGGVLWVGLSGAFAVGAGCSGASTTNTAPAPKEPNSMVGVTSAKSCGRTNPGVGAVRFSDLRQSGAVALARLASSKGSRTLAYVADEDSKAIHTIDVDKKEQIGKTQVKGKPSQV